MTVDDIEFLKRRISLHRNTVQVGQKFEVGQTKGEENRIVPVAASALSRLSVRCEGRSADDLRHTCASLAVSSGANVLAVSRMLRQKDPSVTLRIYADLFDSDPDAVVVSLDAKIADSVQSVSKAPADRGRKRVKSAV